MDLSIIIINYNTKEMTNQTINSLSETMEKGIEFEVILVDNSSDETQKIFKNEAVSKIIHSENQGFGAACNKGAKQSKGRYVLFLNSDTLFKSNKISGILNMMEEDRNIGAAGGKLLLEDGSLDHGCKRGFPTPMASFSYFLKLDRIFKKSKAFGAYRMSYIPDDQQAFVDCISGALMFVRRELFDDISGFDEDYFMYGEDIDLCYRIVQKGFKILYFPEVEVYHIKGQSGLNRKSKKTIKQFYDSMIIFYKKNYKDKYNILTYAMVYLSVKAKYAISLLKGEK